MYHGSNFILDYQSIFGSFLSIGVIKVLFNIVRFYVLYYGCEIHYPRYFTWKMDPWIFITIYYSLIVSHYILFITMILINWIIVNEVVFLHNYSFKFTCWMMYLWDRINVQSIWFYVILILSNFYFLLEWVVNI